MLLVLFASKAHSPKRSAAQISQFTAQPHHRATWRHKNMLEDNRYCGDVLIQLSAVQSALESFGYEILGEHLKTCVVENVQSGNTQILDEALALIKKLK